MDLTPKRSPIERLGRACYAAGARESQAVTSLTQHCHRQLEQFVLSIPILPSHPGEPVLLDLNPHPRPESHNDYHEARVRVVPQLPALLALCLALPHWTSTVRSIKGKTYNELT